MSWTKRHPVKDVHSPRKWTKSLCCALALGVVALSCSSDPEQVAQTQDLTSTSAPVSPSTDAPTTTQAPDNTEVATSATDAPSPTDEDADPTNEVSAPHVFERTTAEGLELSGGPTTHDHGSGSEPSFEVLATGLINSGTTAGTVAGEAGAIVPWSGVWPPSVVLFTIGWVHRDGIFAVIIKTNDTVASVQVFGSDGSADETTPSSDGLAIAAVRVGIQPSSVGDVTINAIDANGNIIGMCTGSSDVSLTCE